MGRMAPSACLAITAGTTSMVIPKARRRSGAWRRERFPRSGSSPLLEGSSPSVLGGQACVLRGKPADRSCATLGDRKNRVGDAGRIREQGTDRRLGVLDSTSSARAASAAGSSLQPWGSIVHAVGWVRPNARSRCGARLREQRLACSSDRGRDGEPLARDAGAATRPVEADSQGAVGRQGHGRAARQRLQGAVRPARRSPSLAGMREEMKRPASPRARLEADRPCPRSHAKEGDGHDRR